MFIRTENLCKSFNGKEVLRDINMEFPENRLTCIIGPNGAGKTTLLRILSLLERPFSGNIFFDGRQLDKDDLGLRRKMAFVMQNPIMFDTSVYNNVSYGLRVRQDKEIKNKVDALLAKVGILEKKKQSAKTLSGGEAQRVAIARALVIEPEVLFLDEPTINLDPLSKKTVEDLILKVKREYKISIVLATHDLSEGERFADRIVILKEGGIIQQGRPGEVFYCPNSLFVAQFLGCENLFKGRIISEDGIQKLLTEGVKIEVITELSEEVYAALRPEDILLSLQPIHSSARNSFPGRIMEIQDKGPICQVMVNAGVPFRAIITKHSRQEMGLSCGKAVYLTFKASAVHVFKS